MLRKILQAIVLPAMLLISSTAFSQAKEVTGKVTDQRDGTPVVGATVTAKGTSAATTTNNEGFYRLTVPAGTTVLVVTSVGFGEMEIDLTNRTNADVVLSLSNTQMSEVVVVGYGTARRRDLTGSVGSIREKDFNKGVITAPDQLLQGKIAGVQVINNSGQPGGGTTVRIRGISSIRSGNQPLYVIDGVPYYGGSTSPGLGTALGGSPAENPLNFINPNDIVSIDVLKDASATAIYGSRGANGVVMVTTKRGVSGEARVDVNTAVGVSSMLRTIDVLDGSEYRAALTSYGLTTGNFNSSVDAIDEITRTAFTTSNNVAISGGTEHARYRFSLGHLSQDGIMGAKDLKIITSTNPGLIQDYGDKGSNFTKYNASLSANYKFLDSRKLGLDLNLLTSHTTSTLAPISNDAGFQGSLVGNALQWNPTHPLYNPDGTVWVVDPALGNTTINPLALLAAYNDVNNRTAIIGSVAPSYKFTNDLEYKFLYSVNFETGTRKSALRNWLNYTGVEGLGFAQISTNRAVNQQFTHTLNYTNDIATNVSLNALVGYEFLKQDYTGQGMQAFRFVDYPGIEYTDYMQNAPAADRSMYSFATPFSELQSFFARAIVNVNDKYTFNATVRRDGSNRFGKNNRYGTFPSFGAAWNIGEEDFLGDGLFSNLRLKASWGKTGNQEFPVVWAPLRVVNIGQGVNQEVINLENPDIKWEENTMYNVGLDFGIMGGRINGGVDYFKRETTDPIFQQIVTQPGPPIRYWKNLETGTIENSGIEVTLNGGLVRTSTLNWNLGVNMAFLKNELNEFVGSIETGGLHGQGISGATSQRLVSGQPINVFYLRHFEGIDKTTGQSIYSLNPDGSDKFFYAGSPNPKMLLGITSDVSFGKFFAVVNLNGAFGHYIYNNTANSVLPIGNLGTRNISGNLVGTSDKESTSNPLAPSDRYLEKGNYLKLSNVQISYALGDFAKVFKGARISLTGQNLLVFTDFTGFDPEVNVDKNVNGVPSLGIEYVPFPTSRTFLLGLSFGL